MVNQQDVFVLGAIHCLKSILKALEDSDETANDIDFQAVLESQRRNRSNPELEKHIVNISNLEDLQ